MAVLSAAERLKVFGHICRMVAWPSLIKPDLSAALNAADQWIEDNQASFNAALPLPFRTTATLTQKTLLFAYVAYRRAGLLKTEDE